MKFTFTGHAASIDKLALKKGDIFEADPDWIRDQGFPAIPHEDDATQARMDAEAIAIDQQVEALMDQSITKKENE